MMTLPFGVVQSAIAHWTGVWKARAAKRRVLDDWDKALLEEGERQRTAEAQAMENKRLDLLAEVEELIDMAAEGLRLAHVSWNLHLDYLGAAHAYVYATADGRILAGHNGPTLQVHTLDFAGLTALKRLLHPGLEHLKEKVLEYEAQASKTNA